MTLKLFHKRTVFKIINYFTPIMRTSERVHRMAVLLVNNVDITQGITCMRFKTKKMQKEHFSGYGLRGF